MLQLLQLQPAAVREKILNQIANQLGYTAIHDPRLGQKGFWTLRGEPGDGITTETLVEKFNIEGDHSQLSL